MIKYLALVLINLTVLASSAGGVENKDVYNIAVIIPLSGNVASMGNYVKNGLDLAYAELPQQQQEKIKLIYEDDQFVTNKTVAAYRKLTSTHDISAVLVIGSPPGNVLSPLVEQDGKLLIAIGASDPTIALGKKLSFIHWVIPEVLGQRLAEEIKKKGFWSASLSRPRLLFSQPSAIRSQRSV